MIKHLYEVKYTIEFQLFKKNGKEDGVPEDMTGDEMLRIVGNADTENMITKAKTAALRTHPAFKDEDDKGPTGKTWKPVKFNLIAISQLYEVHV